MKTTNKTPKNLTKLGGKFDGHIEVKRMRRMNRVLDGRNIKDSRECMKNQTSKGSTEAHLLQL